MKMNNFFFYISRIQFATHLQRIRHALRLYGDCAETALRMRSECAETALRINSQWSRRQIGQTVKAA